MPEFFGRHTQPHRFLADRNACPDRCDSFQSTPSLKSPRGLFKAGCCSSRGPSSPSKRTSPETYSSKANEAPFQAAVDDIGP